MLLQPHSFRLAVLADFDLHRRVELEQFAAFSFGRVDLLAESCHLFFASPVGDNDPLGVQTKRRPCAVHSDISAADNDDFFAGEVRVIIVADPSQQLDSRHDTLSVLAGYSDGLVSVRSNRDIHGIELRTKLRD